jgi:hypothetical protein
MIRRVSRESCRYRQDAVHVSRAHFLERCQTLRFGINKPLAAGATVPFQRSLVQQRLGGLELVGLLLWRIDCRKEGRGHNAR